MNISDGDYITITNKDGSTVEAEIYSKFEIENLGKYILYKINDEMFGAKYIVKDNNTVLNTDLSEEEKKTINELFQSMEVQS